MRKSILTDQEIRKILSLAIKAGKMLLEYGAETYRVEDTINYICRSQGIEKVESFVVPTGIFLSVDYNDHYYSLIKRTKVIRIDLEIIAMVNSFARQFVNEELTIEEGEALLKAIEQAPIFSMPLRLFAGGLAGGFFTVLFGGSTVELLAAFINSVIVVLFTTLASRYQTTFFLKNLLGGMINMTMALVLSHSLNIFDIALQNDIVIIGSLMPLLPGVAIVNAIRDIISGDFVSGSSRFTEAILIAVALALGVGTVLQVYVYLLGGIPWQ